MDRLTWTQEERKREEIGYATWFRPEVCAEYDKRLAAYEDTGLMPDEIIAMREELAKVKQQNADNAVFMAAHGAGGYVFDTRADQVPTNDNAYTTATVAPVMGIPATGNRVLALDEVLALPEGARVWVEDHRWSSLCGEHHVEHNYESHGEKIGFCLVNLSGKYWPLDDDFNRKWFAMEERVWSLPQEPTQAEKDANPWGKGAPDA